MPVTDYKRCGRCRTIKEASAFSRNAAKRDGLATECRECRREMRSKPLTAEMTSCECGCGESIPAINKMGKPARFKHGHHNRRLRLSLRDRSVDEDRGFGTDCWIWTGGRDTWEKYGRAKHRGRMTAAHRAMYEQTFNCSLLPHVQLHHRCGNGLCIRPSHLEPLTRTQHVERHRSAA